ncbi:MAG: dTDP-glucose 4,6-dehydratase [Thermoproteota archaeon]|nr:dTDP-glucose 4,6-dehydratase [Thermoproteota archaeon]
MKLLVTGGLGFIGSNFIRYMIKTYKNDEIVNVDSLAIGSNPANITDLRESKHYLFVKGDIRDEVLMNNLVKDVDAIINIAAETHVDRSITDPKLFLENNTLGTQTILEAIRYSNINARLLQVSTDEVYGDIIKGSFKETDLLKPSSPYAASKASSDLTALAYYRTFGLNVVITRCTNNFGPYQFPEKLIPKTIVRAAMNLSIPIYGTGKNVRDWIFVLDHCKALEAVLKRGKSGEIYNISSGNELTNVELVSRILKIMDRPQNLIKYVEDRPGHDLRYSLDSSKIRKELNWNPENAFDSALDETIKWYKENEKWWKPLATEEILNPTPWKSK